MTKMSPPIVYLDQCHWITLAQTQFAKHKIYSSDELAAADFILKAARDGRIHLPLSGAHMVETASGRTRIFAKIYHKASGYIFRR